MVLNDVCGVKARSRVLMPTPRPQVTRVVTYPKAHGGTKLRLVIDVFTPRPRHSHVCRFIVYAFYCLNFFSTSVAGLGWCFLSSCMGAPMLHSISELWNAMILSGSTNNTAGSRRRRAIGEDNMWEMTSMTDYRRGP